MSDRDTDANHYYRHEERDSYDEREDQYWSERRSNEHYSRRSEADHYERRGRERDREWVPSGPSEPPSTGLRAFRLVLLVAVLGVALAIGVGGMQLELPTVGRIPPAGRTLAVVLAAAAYLMIMKEMIAGLIRGRARFASTALKLAAGVAAGAAVCGVTLAAMAAGAVPELVRAPVELVSTLQDALPY